MPKNTFTSHKPRKYLNIKTYNKQVGDYPNNKYAGHLYKEVCSLCDEPMGKHYSLTCKR